MDASHRHGLARTGFAVVVSGISLLLVSCITLSPPITASTGVAGGDTGEITMADITGDHRADAVVSDDAGHLFWFERCADDSCLNRAGVVDAPAGVRDLDAGDFDGDGTADV